jgi:hypothetical protein
VARPGEARLGRGALAVPSHGDARCAGIYDLHDGRIAGAVEYWLSA